MKRLSRTVKAIRSYPQIIKCSLTDHFTFRTPVPVVFFYRKHISSELIIDALQNVLSDFQIFAGTLIRKSGQLYIDCNNQGVCLSIAHFDSCLFENLSNFDTMDLPIFVDMLDPNKTLSTKGPVLKIKLSYYEDGMAIGYCWHHSIGDMSTFMCFLKALSVFCKGEKYEKPVTYEDRDYFSQNISLEKAPYPTLKRLSIVDLLCFIKQLLTPKRSLYISFTDSQIARLRENLSQQLGRRISRNDALCAYLLDTIGSCRTDTASYWYAAVIVNLRARLALPLTIQGNFVDLAQIQMPRLAKIQDLANQINSSVNNFRPLETFSFVQAHGGIKNIGRIVPKALLPQYKNLLITNWANFDVYTIDFGVISPSFVMPIAISPIPWVASIIEGFGNKGFLVTLILPDRLAKKAKAAFLDRAIK